MEYVEEDNVAAVADVDDDGVNDGDGDGVFFQICVNDYDSVEERDSYIYLGEWKSAAANSGNASAIGSGGFAQIITVDKEVVIAAADGTPFVTGEGDNEANIPAYVDGKPNLSALGVAQRADGDDLLWAFVYNSFLDDTRDRNVGSNDTLTTDAAPATAYVDLATPPYRKLVTSDDEATVDVDETAYATPPYTIDQRTDMTIKSANFVGWRDHTEGHRITTTRGDKIEIVGGNYKFISLGRGHGTVQTDWSGGHLVDVLEAAGNVTSINYRNVPSSVGDQGWQWVEEVVKGNAIERYDGTFKEEFYGDLLITIIGRSNEAAAATGSGPLGDWDTSAGLLTEENNDWDSLQGTSFTRDRPDIIEKVRAKSVFESELLDYSDIDIVGAGVGIYDYLGCRPASYDLDKNKTHYVPTGVNYDSAMKPEDIHEYIHAGYVENNLRASRWEENVETDMYVAYYGQLDSFVNANEAWLGFHQEYFLGAHTQFFCAPYTTLGIANRAEMFVGFEEQLNVGALVKWAPFEYNLSFAKGHARWNHYEIQMTKMEKAAKLNAACLAENKFTVVSNWKRLALNLI